MPDIFSKNQDLTKLWHATHEMFAESNDRTAVDTAPEDQELSSDMSDDFWDELASPDQSSQGSGQPEVAASDDDVAEIGQAESIEQTRQSEARNVEVPATPLIRRVQSSGRIGSGGPLSPGDTDDIVTTHRRNAARNIQTVESPEQNLEQPYREHTQASVERDNLIEEIFIYGDEAKPTMYQSNASSVVPVPEAAPEPFGNGQAPVQPGATRLSQGPSLAAPRTMLEV